MRTPIQIRGSSVIIDLDSLLKWLMQKESLITKLRKEDGIIKFDFNHPYTNTTAHFPDDIILQVDLKAEIDLFVKTVAEEISKTRISQRGQRLHFFRNPLTEDQKNKIKNITLAKVEKPKKEMNSSARP